MSSDREKRRRPEATQEGNPYELTTKQHIHSAACIARFADHRGNVCVRRKGSPGTFTKKPESDFFCAERAWDDATEGIFFREIERRFQGECDSILESGTVGDHAAITAYWAIWQIRSQLAANPLPDVILNGVVPEWHTKDQEEKFESKKAKREGEPPMAKLGVMFLRGGHIPGRIAAGPLIRQEHAFTMRNLGSRRWGIFRAAESRHFICPDRPAGRLLLPLTPQIVLVEGIESGWLSDAGVETANRQIFMHSRAWVFAHPDDGEMLSMIIG